MSFAPNSVYQDTGDGSIRGCFRSTESNVFFEFSACPVEEQWAGGEFDMKVWVSDGTYRVARVMKTRVKVVVDEGPDGSPVVETWVVKQRQDYPVN